MKKIFLAGLVVVVKKNYKFTKAFSLIEILVVVVLIGIVGTFAIPNIHSWMASKELRNDFFTIHKMITTLRTEVELSVYPMGGIFIDNNNGNGLIVKIRHRSQDKYRTYKNSCENIDAQWDETETITAQTNPDIYAKFVNLRLSSSLVKSCLSRGGFSNFSAEFHICHKEQNPNILCDIKDSNPETISNKSSPYESYYMIINRSGHNFLKYFVFKNGNRTKWEHL
mgnify:CR=1 FL=1